MEKVSIQVIFTEQTEFGSFTDALYFKPEEYSAMKQEDVDALKKERVNNWVNMLKNPPPEIQQTEEDLIAQQAQIDETISNLQAQKMEIAEKVSVMEMIKMNPIKIDLSEPNRGIKTMG